MLEMVGPQEANPMPIARGPVVPLDLTRRLTE